MSRVSLVCTVHSEMGRASALELASILERLRPEVVFLEIPPEQLDNYLERTPRSLESVAIGRYRAAHPVTLIPVDLPAPNQELVPDIEHLFEIVERASPEYCRLNFEYDQYVGAYGFAFLNSPISSKLRSAIHETMQKTIGDLGDDKLAKLYAWWTHANHTREEAMVKGVAGFAKRSPFEAGVLLVGASHRQSIIDKSRSLWRTGLTLVHLDFNRIEPH